MKRELYQCSIIGCNGELQNVYFETLYDAEKYAHSNKVKTIKQFAVDMEIVETYEWKSQEREVKVTQEVWDWYPTVKETQHEEISRIQIIGHPVQ